MVGRLVQQQDIGRGRQHPRQRGAAGFAAGDMRRVFVAAEAELFDQIARLIMIVAGTEPGLDIGQRRGETGKIRLLRQIADGGAGLHEAAAAIGLDQPGGDLEQRRFAGAVAADQADALAGRHRQFDARQQRRAAKGQPDIFQLDQRWRHASTSILSCCGLRRRGWRWMRRMVWSSVDRNAERSRGEKDFGPPVTSPDERRSVIRLRTASVMPIDCFRERLAVRRDHLGAGLDAAAGERNIRGDDDVALAGALRDPVVGGVHAGAGGDALDQRILRHADEIARDHADRQAVPDRDAINLVLHRAGVGVDIDAGGVQVVMAQMGRSVP